MDRRYGIFLLSLMLATGDATASQSVELGAAVTIGRIAKVELPEGHLFELRIPETGVDAPRRAFASLPFRVRTNTAFELTIVPSDRVSAAGDALFGAAERAQDAPALAYGAVIAVEAGQDGTGACAARLDEGSPPPTPWRRRIDPEATGMQFDGVLCFYPAGRSGGDVPLRAGRYTGGVSIDIRVLSE